MIPIELVFFLLVIMFGFVGLVRGFLKELGVTTVMAVVLFALYFFDHKMMPMLGKVSARLAPGQAGADQLQTAVYVLALIGIAYISYQGQTLAFAGTEPKGPIGVFLKLTIGLVDGYLIVGSIWYYLDRLGYPVLHITQAQLSSTARWLLEVSPPSLLGPYLLYVAVFLVIFRVIK